ncbi:MAG: PEP-CTERM system histidine kinase PrsK [Opitutaceae bacterium]|nr:PEP-CTERM system histidine kinase PrsK [Opitutaceae bacterium]
MPLTYHLALINALACMVLALAALIRRRQSASQSAFAAGMLLLAARSACAAWTDGAARLEEITQAQVWTLACVALTPAPWMWFSLVYSRGNAAEFVRRWAWVLAASVGIPCTIILVGSHNLIIAVERAAPNAVSVVEFGLAGVMLHGFSLVSMIIITMNLERTYRASVGTMRWRIKYMLLGVAVLNSVQFYVSSQAVLFHGTSTDMEVLHSASLLIACLCIGRSFMRPGQFSIDLHPSHTALYGSITLILAGVYLVVVGVLARFVAFVGGDAAFPVRALVVFLGLVGLAVILQSDRARLVLRHFVSRHFQRPLFDYRSMWQKFAEGMASGTDAASLSHSAVELVSKSFEIQSVSLWLVNERRDGLVLAASTLIDSPSGSAGGAEIADFGEALAHLQAHPEPVDIEEATFPGAAEMRAHHGRQFPKSGHRLCVPLVARGTITGVITLGDRVGGLPYAPHDFDMFRCIGDHVAAALLGVQLSQRLAQSREFEAFQTMATFFVHDLKNAANTLSLLLQNLPDHFQDPEFREDAMKSCGRTVDHINGLIEKLGTLRSGLALQRVPTDLAALTTRALEDWPPQSGITLEQELAPVPEASLDPDQILKVITNLLINAREATPGGGRVRVGTAQRGAFVAVTVIDTGCGMSPEFVRRSLFRPFQTTKKRGLGIGMFQSKMIVEAHGGRIDVRSQPGVGSTFEVLLPLAGS